MVCANVNILCIFGSQSLSSITTTKFYFTFFFSSNLTYLYFKLFVCVCVYFTRLKMKENNETKRILSWYLCKNDFLDPRDCKIYFFFLPLSLCLSFCSLRFLFLNARFIRDLELDIRPDCTFSSPFPRTYTLVFVCFFVFIIYDTYEKLSGVI